MLTMPSETTTDLLSINPCDISISRELRRSDASSIFEIELNGSRCAMKLFHDNGDPDFTKRGRDLNRFRCEFKAYQNFNRFGVCKRGYVPRCHGYVDRLDPAMFHPYLNHFCHDKFNPRAVILEYLRDVEELNCVNYSDQRSRKVMDGIKEIHNAFIHHHDIHPKNIVIVPGNPERVLWIDFDVSVTFSSKESMGCKEEEYSQYEVELVACFGEVLREDQKQGFPPNTKYY